MSVEATGSDNAITRRDTAINKPKATGTCDGCRELTQRVERLEQQLLDRQPGAIAAPSLSTANCYWICIAVHAVITFCLFSSMFLIAAGLVVLMGAFGTAAVCHVFSTRTIPEKVLRTFLSCSIVVASALIPLALQDSIELDEIFPYILLFLPFVFLSGWFVAKIFVWTRGWKLVPPGRSSEYPKLQIRHLMICTLFVAVHLAVSRFLVDDVSEIFSEETLAAGIYALFLAMICTLFSSVLARILLSHRPAKLFRNLALFTAITATCALAIFGVIAGISGSGDFDVESLIGFSVYLLVVMIALFASPAFTFVMLRSANYRLIHA